jgi:DNA processing protein
MNTLEGKAWQALAAAKGIGPKALWRVAEYLLQAGKPASWLLRNPARAREALAGARGPFVLPDADVLGTGEGEPLAGQGIGLLHPLHPGFPRRVRERKDRLLLPAVLYVSGSVSLLANPGLAIVGSRDAAADALDCSEKLAREMAAAGVTVVSGYAAGIDAAAHLGALRARGTTVMVLAEGIDRFQVKPALRGLLNDGNALVVSAFAPGSPWTAFQAMARNKLVAALADALVVVASGPERDANGRMSGSFDAGLSALKLGVPLWIADPGSFSSTPAGNRELINRGGRAWSPTDGGAPILAALKSGDEKPAQKSLF